jgi:hypothetical protein
MKHLIITLFLALVISPAVAFATADQVEPAETEDLEQFDSMLQNRLEKGDSGKGEMVRNRHRLNKKAEPKGKQIKAKKQQQGSELAEQVAEEAKQVKKQEMTKLQTKEQVRDRIRTREQTNSPQQGEESRNGKGTQTTVSDSIPQSGGTGGSGQGGSNYAGSNGSGGPNKGQGK